jgi:hypothetical protein
MSDRWILCTSCDKPRRHFARGWCSACWRRWDAAGQPESGPPPSPYRRWDEYYELTQEMGHTRRQAVERMGISLRTALRYEARLRVVETVTNAQGAA